MSTDQITLRPATVADIADLERLAALDSSRVPPGRLLVAERDGQIVAALAPADSAVIADPFQRTADVVDLLREWAAERAPRRRLGRLVPAH